MRPVCAVTRITAPNTIRYHANAANECRLTKRISNLTASSALTNDTTQLTISGPTSNARAPRAPSTVSYDRRRQQHGNRDEEGKFRGRAARQAAEQSTDDGGAGAAGARDQRQRLEGAELQRVRAS